MGGRSPCTWNVALTWCWWHRTLLSPVLLGGHPLAGTCGGSHRSRTNFARIACTRGGRRLSCPVMRRFFCLLINDNCDHNKDKTKTTHLVPKQPRRPVG